MQTIDDRRGSGVNDPYVLKDGIYVPPWPLSHREEEYNSSRLATLRAIQRDHFWYRGRHRFLLHAVDRHLGRPQGGRGDEALRLIDLGGGCGGWPTYLAERQRFSGSEIAMADSSTTALRFAGEVLPPTVDLYQVDLLNLGWRSRWDVAFLLDVLEHIPDHEEALRQIRDALAPGGLLFVTVPAFQTFWSFHDELAGHQRRYRRPDFRWLADQTGFRLRDARYFMFFLSPLLLVSRQITTRKLRELPRDQWTRESASSMAIPHPLVNAVLSAIFKGETPLGHHVPFPWGSSLLAVLEKSPEAG